MFNDILCISLEDHKDLLGDYQQRKHYLQGSRMKAYFSSAFLNDVNSHWKRKTNAWTKLQCDYFLPLCTQKAFWIIIQKTISAFKFLSIQEKSKQLEQICLVQ